MISFQPPAEARTAVGAAAALDLKARPGQTCRDSRRLEYALQTCRTKRAPLSLVVVEAGHIQVASIHLLVLQEAQLEIRDALGIPQHQGEAVAARAFRQRWVENGAVGNLKQGTFVDTSCAVQRVQAAAENNELR